MDLQLHEAIEVLGQTPGVLDALLRHKSAAWLDCRKASDAFSPIDVLGHLTLAETTNWLPRIRMILAGDMQPFPPFDRFNFQPLIAGKSVAEILGNFAAVRAESLQTLEGLHLTQQQLNLSGVHPQFGRVTLRQQLATWAVHDLGHIDQIVKTFAHQYSDAVGPWQAYLSILH